MEITTSTYCLWVAGSFKGNGYGKELLEYAIEDAKKQGKNGICTMTSKLWLTQLK